MFPRVDPSHALQSLFMAHRTQPWKHVLLAEQQTLHNPASHSWLTPQSCQVNVTRQVCLTSVEELPTPPNACCTCGCCVCLSNASSCNDLERPLRPGESSWESQLLPACCTPCLLVMLQHCWCTLPGATTGRYCPRQPLSIRHSITGEDILWVIGQLRVRMPIAAT